PNEFAVVAGAAERHAAREGSACVRCRELSDLRFRGPSSQICGPLQGHNPTRDGTSGGVREAAGNGHGLVDFGRALARRDHDRRAGQPRWRRWRWRRGRRGRNLTELRGPRGPRDSETDADRAVRFRPGQPGGLVPAVDDVQGREELVEVPGPAVRADARVEGIAPDLVELVL